jgi:hypothetical protein
MHAVPTVMLTTLHNAVAALYLPSASKHV